MTNFDLEQNQRLNLYKTLIERLENYYCNTASFKVSPHLDHREIIDAVRKYDFESPLTPEAAAMSVADGLEKYAVHTPHPQYYGLFNPRANISGIMADLITATYNPQMAAWSHSPFAVEVENYLIHEFGKKFGYGATDIDGVFATGGAEANLTAVLCALNQTFPDYANLGLAGIDKRPILYCSSQAHHSIVKAARIVGLGLNAVRSIPVEADMRMNIAALRSQVEKDVQAGLHPFMVVGTAGATGPGAIDDLDEIANIASRFNLWFHADAAYGGAAILHTDMKAWLTGIEKSHSITFDVHKWLSVPMGASMFITRFPEILHQTFRITADYMPKDAKDLQITDPFTHSILWSRRFNGLKLYLSLLMFGWKGYAEVIKNQTNVGTALKKLLKENGWLVKNETPLPIACFTDPELQDDPDFATSICDAIVKSGKAWISVYPINGVNTLRACITNYATSKEDIAVLVGLLNEKREEYKRSNNFSVNLGGNFKLPPK